MGGFEYVLMTLMLLLVLILVILLLVRAHYGSPGRSYRPGEPWDFEPVIISAASRDGVGEAVGTTDLGELGMVDEADVIAEVSIGSEGGSSVRW